jgi:hypothetical protein
MACNTSLTAILKDCSNNIGGVTNFYVAPSEFVSGITVTNGTATAITMSGNSKFVEFQFNKNTANYTEEGTISLENGSTFFLQTVNLVIPRREVAKRNAIALIASGQRDLKIIMKDSNGLYWLSGLENSANLTAVGDGSGTAKGDGSKYTLTFVAEEPQQMPEVNSSIIAGIIS